jgi:Fe-S-cluster containining protein
MPTPLEKLGALHRAVDTLAGQIAQKHGDRLKCGRGCSACCLDGLTVFEIEAERIRRFVGQAMVGEAPSAKGCAFLGPNGECRVYEVRPYVCRTQGLPLRWMDEENGEFVEFRDICELNVEGPPLDELAPDSCWTIGHVESLLRQLQEEFSEEGALKRVPLRALFDELSERTR